MRKRVMSVVCLSVKLAMLFVITSIFLLHLPMLTKCFDNPIAYAAVEKSILIPDSGTVKEYFGTSVAINAEGNIAVVGANRYDNYKGAVYIFRENTATGTWSEVKKITSSDLHEELNDYAHFGYSVDIDGPNGNKIVVGAYLADSIGGSATGAVYTFEWKGGDDWEETKKLIANDGVSAARFGWSVDMSRDGSVLVVGEPSARDSGGEITGAAYVFVWNESERKWEQYDKLIASASDREFADNFGTDVATDVNGTTIVVGAYRDNNENGEDAGAAYVFKWDGYDYDLVEKLIASDGEEGDSFGRSVGIDNDAGTTIVVGAAKDNNENGEGAGAAYIFRWNGYTWDQIKKIMASDGEANDFFGESVAIGGKDNSKIVIGGQLSVYHNKKGAAYIFDRDNGWDQVDKLTGSEGELGDEFGSAISMSMGNEILVGALYDDNKNGTNAGAAYVYVLESSACDPENIHQWQGEYVDVVIQDYNDTKTYLTNGFEAEENFGLVLCSKDNQELAAIDFNSFKAFVNDPLDESDDYSKFFEVMIPNYPASFPRGLELYEDPVFNTPVHSNVFPMAFDNLEDGDVIFNLYGHYFVIRPAANNDPEDAQYFLAEENGTIVGDYTYSVDNNIPLETKQYLYIQSYEKRKEKLQNDGLSSSEYPSVSSLNTNLPTLRTQIDNAKGNSDSDSVGLLEFLYKIEERQKYVLEHPDEAVVDPSVAEINQIVAEAANFASQFTGGLIQIPPDALWTIIWREDNGVSFHGPALRPDQCNLFINKDGNIHASVGNDGIMNVNTHKFSDSNEVHNRYSIGNNEITTHAIGAGMRDDAVQSIYFGTLIYADGLWQVDKILDELEYVTSLDQLKILTNPPDRSLFQMDEVNSYRVNHETYSNLKESAGNPITMNHVFKILELKGFSSEAIAYMLYYHGADPLFSKLNYFLDVYGWQSVDELIQAFEWSWDRNTTDGQNGMPGYFLYATELFEDTFKNNKPWENTTDYVGERFGVPSLNDGFTGRNPKHCNEIPSTSKNIPSIPFGDSHVVTIAGLNFTFTGNLQGGAVTVLTFEGIPTIGQSSNTIFLNNYWHISATMPNNSFEAEVTFPYTDQDVMDSGLNENDLIVMYYDGDKQIWKEAESIKKDTTANTITIHTDHFSLWAIGAFVAANQPPMITLLEPDGVDDSAETSFTITWSDDDQDDDAGISLYYDTDNSGEDGTLIVEGLSEDNETDQYLWDTTNIADGTYYIYAVIDDGVNAPVVAYSDGPVTIVTLPPGPTPTPSQNPIPEPGTIILLIIGLICMFAVGRGILKRK